jgi:nucleoside-diphosphate-sugar epimerase
MEILLTGRNGFLGKEIYSFFIPKHKINSIVRSFPADRTEKVKAVDLSEDIPDLYGLNYDIVIHAAGKAHFIPKTQEEKDSFYTENVSISKNLLAALEQLKHKPKQFIFISSVAVYGLDNGIGISEDVSLNATDAYGKSKIESEKLITAWCVRHNVVLTILRLPLIAGENPPGNLGDMISAIKRGRFPLIANGMAKRSIVLAKDVPVFIDLVRNVGGIYHLTDGHNPSFKELTNVLMRGGRKAFSIPLPIAKLMAFTGDIVSKITSKEMPFNSRRLDKMTSSLTFSNDKATKTAGWKPTSVLDYYKKLS